MQGERVPPYLGAAAVHLRWSEEGAWLKLHPTIIANILPMQLPRWTNEERGGVRRAGQMPRRAGVAAAARGELCAKVGGWHALRGPEQVQRRCSAPPFPTVGAHMLGSTARGFECDLRSTGVGASGSPHGTARRPHGPHKRRERPSASAERVPDGRAGPAASRRPSGSPIVSPSRPQLACKRPCHGWSPCTVPAAGGPARQPGRSDHAEQRPGRRQAPPGGPHAPPAPQLHARCRHRGRAPSRGELSKATKVRWFAASGGDGLMAY